MKKAVIIFIIALISIPASAQFALKGGVTYAEKELQNFVVTGQFYKDLLVISGDLLIPTQKCKKVAGAGRIGLGLGSDRIRFAADLEGRELDEAELDAVAGGYSWDEFMQDFNCIFYLLMASAI